MAGRRMGALLKLLNLTSVPAAPTAGDIWYRSDLKQVRSSDGAAGEPLTIGPSGNLPVISTGRWHGLPPFGNAAGANVPVDRMFAIPFWPGRACTITGLAVNTTLALVGGNVRMGLYNADAQGLPSTLIADYGTVTAGVLGIRSITGMSTVVRPVLHYIVIGRQGGVLNLGLSTRSTWEPTISETTPVIATNLNAYYIDGVGGALPASYGVPAGADQGPCVVVQLT